MILINTEKSRHEYGGFFIRCEDSSYSLRLIHANAQEQATQLRNRQIHRHQVYHLVLVKKGEGTFVIRGRPTKVKSGNLVILSPHESHCLGVNTDEVLHFGEITFELINVEANCLDWSFEKLLSFLSGKITNVPDVIPPSERLQEKGLIGDFLRQIENIRESVGYGMFFHMQSSTILSRLLVELSCSFSGLVPQNTNRTPLERVYLFIRENYNSQFNLEELSEIAGLNRKYLSSRFKEAYGTTPIYYRDQLRISTACELLKGFDYGVGEIADRCGFRDVYYFSRFFKKQVGRSPTEYRKKYLSSK